MWTVKFTKDCVIKPAIINNKATKFKKQFLET